jgi:Protein of unknown function (DUF3667)
MSHELETAAAGSLGGFLRGARKHALPVGTPCPNCATPLEGPWCHVCGQRGEDYHRSIGRLLAETLEGLFHLDGRMWRTAPDLMLRPGRLTRAYLDGHRAPQIPPLRLFLVVLLAIFLAGGLTNHSKPPALYSHNPADPSSRSFDQLTPAQRATVSADVGTINVRVGNPKVDAAATSWLRGHLGRTIADPERFYLILEQWSERFAFLMLPVSALLLSVLFIFQRRFYLYDHTIFSLHSLSAVGLMITAAMLASAVIGDDAFLVLFAAPVHLFAHLRGVYRTSAIGTLIRMFLLFIGSVIAALLLVLSLVAVGLNSM